MQMETTMEQDRIEEKKQAVESYFAKYGANPVETKSHEKYGFRTTYEQGGIYYRVDESEIEGRIFLVISAADDPKFADVGVMEDVAAFPADLSDEKMEKEVRYVLEVEPYPDDYPDYD